MESIRPITPPVPQNINNDQSSCFINMLILVILALVAYILITSSSKNTNNDDNDDDDDENEFFTDNNQCGTYSNNYESGSNSILKCDPTIDYTDSTNMACRQWYIRNNYGVEFFGDNFSQDTIIDTLFSLGNITIPVYVKPFQMKHNQTNTQNITRVMQFFIDSVKSIQDVMGNIFSKLKTIVDSSGTSFDPFIATCNTQITLASILFEMYTNIINGFFTPSVQNVTRDVMNSVMYFMPTMMYLRTRINTLLESSLVVLNKNNSNENTIALSSINTSVFNTIQEQVQNEISVMLSTNMTSFGANLPSFKSNNNSFDSYINIMYGILKNMITSCQKKAQTIQSQTQTANTIGFIINADLIHVFYRAYLFYVALLRIMVDKNIPVSSEYTHSLSTYEKLGIDMILESSVVPIFTLPQVDTSVSSFTCVESLRRALIDTARSLDQSSINSLVKYDRPGNIGSIFMQILNSQSEIVAMPLMQAKAYLIDYVSTLPDSFLNSFIPNASTETFSCDVIPNEKRYSIGKCINKCLQQKKQKMRRSHCREPQAEMFGDVWSSGDLTATDVRTTMNNNKNHNKYDTSGHYVLDCNGNYVLDSSGNFILSSDYINGTNISTIQNYIPALDAPYPILQSQSGKAAFDIRGIPDTPQSFAPISGLPGRPVT